MALDLALWGVADPGQLAWLDPPPTGAFAQAILLLQDLDAVDGQGRITDTGRQMAALPLHPRLAHMLIAAKALGLFEKACDLAVLLSERDVMAGALASEKSADIDERLHLLAVYREHGAVAVKAMGANPGLCAQIVRTSAELKKLFPSRQGALRDKADVTPAALASLAYPDRIARRKAEGSGQYLMANGRIACLQQSDPLRNFEFLSVMQLDAGRSEGKIYLAGALDLSDISQLHGHRLCHEEEVAWNDRERTVRARRLTRLAKLILAEQPLAKPDPDLLAIALLDGIRQVGIAVLPWTEEARQTESSR